MKNSTKKHETTRMLRVIYSNPERLELGKKLSETFNDLTQINADLDRVKADFKAKVTARESEIVDLSNKVSTGFHITEVKCLWEMDTPKTGVKELIRLDTGETVEMTDMTNSDKQGELPLSAEVTADGKIVQPATAPTGVEKDGSVTVPADSEKK
jgi:hypothetical protein